MRASPPSLASYSRSYETREKLAELGWGQLCKQYDLKVAAEAAGLDLRSVTKREVQAHLDDFGLEKEFGTFGKIRGLSGGQKVKLVLAAAMWNQPHLLVLDEPTNYLDRDALGALAAAIKAFAGGVLMITHNKEFYSALCDEEWHVDAGKVVVQGEAGERLEASAGARRKSKKAVADDDDEDKCTGNTNGEFLSSSSRLRFHSSLVWPRLRSTLPFPWERADRIEAVAKIVRNEKNRAMSKAEQRKAAKAAKKGK